MAVWAMLVGMVTLVNITMVGAMTSLAGNIPDSSFLAILSRYLGDRGGPEGALLYPLEAASRLERLRRRVLLAVAVSALAAAGLTVWSLAAGWGAVAMSAITLWALVTNIALLQVPLSLWRRRAGRIRQEDMEEAWRKSRRTMEGETGGDGGRDEGG